ncbi:hypothetical protein AVEN_88311-1 [Araneus ventricosus]|uniref:Uncharacterized protein n=1 Tax=Araneus ventricosus TaxID=182803 RepID=A0A4Y2S136_ARAVE|nr:hypothetical protein AVEN_88311-1 [Araneus ventricosus]
MEAHRRWKEREPSTGVGSLLDLSSPDSKVGKIKILFFACSGLNSSLSFISLPCFNSPAFLYQKNTVPSRSFIAQFLSQNPKHFQSSRHRIKILNLRQDAKLSSEARQTNQQPLVHAPKTCS